VDTRRRTSTPRRRCSAPLAGRRPDGRYADQPSGMWPCSRHCCSTVRPATRSNSAPVGTRPWACSRRQCASAGADIRRLHLNDLDRHRGRLTVTRPGHTHTIYLDELTINLATAWLRERTQRRHRTTNPHLLITEQKATDNRNRPLQPSPSARSSPHLASRPASSASTGSTTKPDTPPTPYTSCAPSESAPTPP
jgi:hypothetical protein